MMQRKVSLCEENELDYGDIWQETEELLKEGV